MSSRLLKSAALLIFFALTRLTSAQVPSALPTPIPLGPPPALPTLTNFPAPSGLPTPLPDGTLPALLPPLPTPVPLPDAQTLSEDLNLALPPQAPEPLRSTPETERLKDSAALAEKQKAAVADFVKAIEELAAKQRNPKYPNLTLEGAIRLALQANPTILTSAQQIRLAQGQVLTVRAQAIPQLNINTSYNQQGMELARNGRSAGDITIPNPGGSPIVLSTGGSDPQNKTWTIQFAASQLLYDGGATISGIRVANAAEANAYFSLRSTIDNIIAQVKINFYQVLLNRALIVAQNQSVALLTQQLKDQDNRFEAGTVPRFNVLQAEVALANAKPPLIQAQNNYRIALYQLVRLLGMNYAEGALNEVPFNVVGFLSYTKRKIDADQSIRVGVARNPALKAQRQSIISQAANVDVQFAGFLPSVSATAGYQINNNLASTSLSQTVEDWFFGATGSWAVWDGFATAGRVQQARAQVEQARINYDNSVRTVILDVQQAISNLQTASETIDSQTASVVQGAEALRLAQERLDAGAGTQLDVLNAQTSLLQSQTFVLQARFSYIQALAQYDQALSLDTQYEDGFDDPLTRTQARQFKKLNEPGRPQAPLPKAMRATDPLKPILDDRPRPAKKKSGINK